MPTNPASEELSFLKIVAIPDVHREAFKNFISACQSNDTISALQLASDQEPAALTWGLIKVMEWSHLELARQLLLHGVKWDTETVRAASKSFGAIKLLFEFGFNVNTGLLGGSTLLLNALGHNEELSIRYLLRHGADPILGPSLRIRGRIQTEHVHDSGLALNKAAAICRLEIFALLLEHGAVLSDSIALHRAAGTARDVPPGERILMLEFLIGLGLDINAPDDAIKIAEDGRGQHGSPLQYAIRWRRIEEARWLLENGADPDKKTPWGKSARDTVSRFPENDEFSILLSQTWAQQP